MLGTYDYRKGFLELMRNMGPQVLLLTLSVSLFLGASKISSPLFKYGYYILAVLFCLLCIYAWLVSAFFFIENSLSTIVRAEREAAALRESSIGLWRRAKIFLSLVWAYKKPLWKELTVAILLTAACGVTAVVIGVAYGVKLAASLAQ